VFLFLVNFYISNLDITSFVSDYWVDFEDLNTVTNDGRSKRTEFVRRPRNETNDTPSSHVHTHSIPYWRASKPSEHRKHPCEPPCSACSVIFDLIVL